MSALILRACLLAALWLLAFTPTAPLAAQKQHPTESKTDSPSGTPDRADEAVSRRPEVRRPAMVRPQPGSITGRASHREGPPPPSSLGAAGALKEKEAPQAGEVLKVPPVTVAASPLSTAGPPAPGGMIRKEGALEPTSLEDKLLEKGLITREDWLEIKAEEERRLAERTEAIEFTGSPRWYERIRMYGYGQFRYNRLGHPNGQLESWQDRSVGSQDPGFFYRRIRWVITGQISDRVGIFFQPDLASEVDGNTHVATLRDAWGEYYFDQNKEYRFRVGLQRVPCSWDNWQATRQRMAIDRADATNACSPSERDLGLSFQWTPKWAQHRWKQMIDYMYGAGDWGMVNLTVYNGQGLNNPELNENKHVGIRLAYPFELPGGRLFEIGMNANRGKFKVEMGTPQSTSTTLFSLNEQKSFVNTDYQDEHLNFFIYYPPQPWGFIAEYITGRTPKRGADGIVRTRSLYGGYVQGHYQWKYSDTGLVNMYTRWQEYYGGLKHLTGAPDGRMRELEIGAAWMPDPQWEITAAYTFTERMNFSQMTAPAPGFFTVPPPCGTEPGQNPPPSTPSSTVIPPPNNANCQPQPQFSAYGNLIRLQIMWFWN